MTRSEKLAKQAIETVHTGARAEYQKRQSDREPDFELIYVDGTKAAVEVTTSTCQESLKTLDQLKKIGPHVDAIKCQHSWLLVPRPGALMKWVRTKIDQYLADVEKAGIEDFFDGQRSPPVLALCADLKILEGQTLQLPPPPRIWFSGPTASRSGSIVKVEDLVNVIEVEAAKNKNKAWPPDCFERHIFVYVDLLSEGAWQAMLCGCIPDHAPILPAEITHAWAVAEVPQGIIVWTYEPTIGWRNRGVINGGIE